MKYRGSFLLTEPEVNHLIDWYEESIRFAENSEDEEEYRCRSEELSILLKVEKKLQAQI